MGALSGWKVVFRKLKAIYLIPSKTFQEPMQISKLKRFLFHDIFFNIVAQKLFLLFYVLPFTYGQKLSFCWASFPQKIGGKSRFVLFKVNFSAPFSLLLLFFYWIFCRKFSYGQYCLFSQKTFDIIIIEYRN